MPARRIGINLLPKTEFESSFWGRGLKWAITTGRYILILVELVVIIAFLSRFKLDKDLADLSDSITGKKAVLEAAFASEQNFRLVAARLNDAETLLTSQIGARQVVGTVTGYLPPEVGLTSLVVQPAIVTLSGQTNSQAGLATLLSRMIADKIWESIGLTEVQATPNQGIQFTVVSKR